MIAIDTNIIVRFLTKDDKEQFAKVEQLFKQHSGDGTYGTNETYGLIIG